MSEQADCGANCEEALAELEAYLDGELTDVEVGRLSSHLADCYPCADRAGFEEQLRAIVRRGCVESAPDGLIQRIQRHLADSA